MESDSPQDRPSVSDFDIDGIKQDIADSARQLAEAVAEQTGRDPDDLLERARPDTTND